MKNRVLLTTREYRLVGNEWRTLLERADGHDAMGVRRWYGLTEEQKAKELDRVVDQIGDALKLRAKRRRKGAK